MILRTSCAAVTAALCIAPVPCQQIAEGLLGSQTSLPPAASGVLVLPGDRVVHFDGTDLVLSAPGLPTQQLLHLPSPVFASFTIAAGPATVLFGESSTHGIWLVPLSGPQPVQPLATVPFNYDAVMLGAQRALLSAKTSGFATPDNDLLVIDLATGATQQLASLPGASGPVTVSANGDVYYATSSLAFPTPPGQTNVLRFRRATIDTALQQQSVLGTADAEVVMTGLDAASDICFDDDGDLLYSDWWNNEVGELNDATGASPWLGVPLVAYGLLPGAASLHFVAGNGPGVFEPFQPDGGRLFVHETDFFATSSLRSLRAAQPDLTTAAPSPVPAGNFTLQVGGGPAGGLGLVAIALDATPGSQPIAIGGFEQPLHLSLAMSAGPILWAVGFDAQGSTALTICNPGFAPASAVTGQAIVFSMTGALGCTPPAVLLLGQ
jgi:hypothetical protein